jgi:hypothetical protein
MVDLGRDRYRIDPDCMRLRPKRIGAGWQQLRASAAVVSEWLRVCFRQGWLSKNGRHQEPGRLGELKGCILKAEPVTVDGEQRVRATIAPKNEESRAQRFAFRPATADRAQPSTDAA